MRSINQRRTNSLSLSLSSLSLSLSLSLSHETILTYYSITILGQVVMCTVSSVSLLFIQTRSSPRGDRLTVLIGMYQSK